jgi:hypothetical protein
MFYRQRKRQQEIAEAESAGSSFWTQEFCLEARLKVWYAFIDAVGQKPDVPVVAGIVRTHLLRDEGLAELTGSADPTADLGDYFTRLADGDLAASVIEAMLLTLREVAIRVSYVSPTLFTSRVNDILMSERISFELVGAEMVPKESQELHAEVVAPLLRLLSGRRGWEVVEVAYQAGLRELADGKFDNSITDAGTALQEALKQRGCSGNALGPLLASAKQKGVLAAHDQPLSDGIGKLIDWVSADRSTLGDGHRGASPATAEDAWLTVHIVGALILRLTGEPRSI